MERLWAPWRTVYIGKEQGKSACIFCDKLQSDQDEANYVLLRGGAVFALLNLYPYTNGHLMVAPVRHVGEIEQLTGEEMQALGETTRQMVGLLKAAFNPHGFNIGANLGNVAGAGVPGHLHIHIVPRWAGDTNFMPVLGDVRVISEGLNHTYQKLKEALKNYAPR